MEKLLVPGEWIGYGYSPSKLGSLLCKGEIVLRHARFGEEKMLVNFGKRLLIGLAIAAFLVGAHAAVVYSVVG